MKIDDCYQIGHIVKTHGLKGEVNVKLDVDFPEDYEELESVFLEQSGNLVPFFISEISISGKKVKIKFEDINSIQKASELVKAVLYRPLSELPKLENGKYFYHDLVGFEVFEKGKLIGAIKSIYQASSQFLAAIDHNGKEVLVPIGDHIFVSVDTIKKKIEVKLPDGLLEVYL